MTTIDRVNTELTADGARFHSAFDSAIAKADKFGNAVIPMVGKAATAAAAALATAAAAASAVYLKSAEAAGRLADTADRIGIATEKLAGYRHAAELGGMSSDKLDQSLVRMNRGIVDAANGTGKAAEYLEKFGLANQHFFSQTPDQQFAQLADKIADLHSQQAKAAATAALFGDKQAALLPVLADGSAGLAQMQRDAQMLGIALTRVDTAKLEFAGDQLERAGKRLQGLGSRFSIEIAPYVSALAEDFVGATTGANDLNVAIADLVRGGLRGVGYIANFAKMTEMGFRRAGLAVANLNADARGALAEFDRRMTANKNKVPGIIALEDPEIQAAATKARIAANLIAYEIDKEIAKGLPTERIDKWAAEVQRKADEMAAKLAAQGAAQNAPSKVVDFSEQKELQKVRKRLDDELRARQDANDAIYQQSLLLQGRLVDAENIRYENERQQRQRELQDILADTKVKGEEKQRIEDEFNEADYLALQQHHWRLAQARKQEAKNAKALADEKKKYAYQSTNEYLGALAALSSGAASHYKAFFRLQQLAAISATWIATIEAAQKSYAWAASWGGPYAGAAAAAIAYGAGIANVAAISQQQFGGGGSGSSAVAGALPGSDLGNDVPVTSAADTQQLVDSRQPIQFNFYGPVGTNAEQFLEDLKELMDRDYVFIEPGTAQARALKLPR